MGNFIRATKAGRQLLGLGAMALLAILAYSQTAVAQAPLAPCPTTGTYADLVDVFVCTIDDKVFGGFSDSFGGGIDLPGIAGFDGLTAGDINYTVYNANGLEGFTFQVDVPLNDSFSLFYQVICLDFSNCIASTHADLTATGPTQLTDRTCFGLAEDGQDGLSPCVEFDFSFLSGGSQSQSASIDPPVDRVIVGKTISCGTLDTFGGPAAQVEGCSVSITNTVDQVGNAPAPATLALLGAGLLGLAASRRRLRC